MGAGLRENNLYITFTELSRLSTVLGTRPVSGRQTSVVALCLGSGLRWPAVQPGATYFTSMSFHSPTCGRLALLQMIVSSIYSALPPFHPPSFLPLLLQ